MAKSKQTCGNSNSFKISKIRDVKSPSRGTRYSAGLDFFVPNDFETTIIKPNSSVKIPSGIKASVPENYALIAFNKSGVALSGLAVGACVVDEDYQGEINLHMFNVSSSDVTIEPGKKLTQFILLPVIYPNVEVVELENLYAKTSDRGTGGFGSTGLV